MSKLIQKVQVVFLRFCLSERGNLRDLTWEVGIGVVVVAVLTLMMTVARDTTSMIWSRFVNFVTSSFGF